MPAAGQLPVRMFTNNFKWGSSKALNFKTVEFRGRSKRVSHRSQIGSKSSLFDGKFDLTFVFFDTLVLYLLNAVIFQIVSYGCYSLVT